MRTWRSSPSGASRSKSYNGNSTEPCAVLDVLAWEASMLDFKNFWAKGLTFEAFVASCKAEHCGLWQGIYNLARVPSWAREAVPPSAPRKLLVIAEDWCGDASNTVPVIAKFADATPGLELRVLQRDTYPEVMDQYLTNGPRSIPLVIALDE